MAFWRRIWQRDSSERLAACTALDVGTEFAKALVFEIDDDGHGTVRGVGRKRQGLAHMQSGTVADIAAVVDNCAVALQEAEEMAGFRPTQVVIGIAGELVKGFTTTHSQERKKPDQPITEAELQKLIDAVQREALHEAERAITWETGLPHVDVRLVHAAVTGASIDGYALTNPVGFQGRHVKIGIFNAFAPLVHLGALQSVASQLDLELLEIVAEPYAVARVLGSDQVRQAGALFVDVGGGTTDVALVRQGGIEGTRMFALGGRAFTKSLADRLDLPFPRAEALKVDYARGLAVEQRDEVAAIVGDDVRVWAAGVELVMEELSGGDLLPGRIYLCGGGSRLPEIQGALAVAGVLGAAAVRPAARGHGHGPRPDRHDRRRDGPARRPAGRHAARARLPGDRAADLRGRARCGPAPGPARDEGLRMAGRIIYLDVDDEITSAATRIRTSEASRVAVVLPYGSRVATSRINFRLLSRDALTHEKRLSIVSGDPATRALAASAGLPVFSSVAEYEASVAGLEDERGERGAGGRCRRRGRRSGGAVAGAACRDRCRVRGGAAGGRGLRAWRRPPARPSQSHRSPRRRQPQRSRPQGRRSRPRRATARSAWSSRRRPSARRRRHHPSSARPSAAPSRAPDRRQRRSPSSQRHGTLDHPRRVSAAARSVAAGSGRPGSSEPRSSGWRSSSPASAPICCCPRRGSSSRRSPSPSAPSR